MQPGEKSISWQVEAVKYWPTPITATEVGFPEALLLSMFY